MSWRTPGYGLFSSKPVMLRHDYHDITRDLAFPRAKISSCTSSSRIETASIDIWNALFRRPDHIEPHRAFSR